MLNIKINFKAEKTTKNNKQIYEKNSGIGFRNKQYWLGFGK